MAIMHTRAVCQHQVPDLSPSHMQFMMINYIILLSGGADSSFGSSTGGCNEQVTWIVAKNKVKGKYNFFKSTT